MIEPKRVLVIHASARQGRNTDAMLDTFLQAVERNDAYVCEHLYMYHLKISPCIACFSCKKEGICPIPDDMQECCRKIEESDIIVIGTPVYFNGVPAAFKMFIDRCQPFYYRTYCLNHMVKAKAGYLLVCCDEGMGEPFIGVEKTIEALFCCINTKMDAHYYCVLNKKPFNELVKESDDIRELGKSLVDNLNQ